MASSCTEHVISQHGRDRLRPRTVKRLYELVPQLHSISQSANYVTKYRFGLGSIH